MRQYNNGDLYLYLIITKYNDDAERKRIEYAFERWKSTKNIIKPEGISVIVKDENIEEMLDDLYSRVSDKNDVEVYNISEASLEIKPDIRKIKVDLDGDLPTIEKFINFILAKQKASFSDIDELSGKIYHVHTKKGRAEIIVNLKEVDGKVRINIRIEGYGDAAKIIYDRIYNEIEYLKEV